MRTYKLPYIAKGVNHKKETSRYCAKKQQNKRKYIWRIPYTGHMLKEINLHDGLADFAN